jgi:Na+/H+ antiporter NhaD/arsenite permease-like protein/S1-C subfamily serine protease
MKHDSVRSWVIVLGIFISICLVWYLLKGGQDTSKPADSFKWINFEPIAKSAAPAIVKISNSAYGVIIHPNGYVVTIADAIKTRQDLYVATLQGQSLPAMLVKSDPDSPLALIKIMNSQNLPAVRAALSGKIEPGDWLFTMTDNLDSPVPGKIISINKDLIVTDLHSASGLPGKPFFNCKGELIGIAVVHTGQEAIHVLPIDLIRSFIELINKLSLRITLTPQGDLIDWLGGSFSVRREANNSLSLTAVQIDKHSPLARGGLKPGDKVVKINNDPILNVGNIENLLPDLLMGKKIKATVVRDGRVRELSFSIRKVALSKGFSPLPALFVLLVFIGIYYLVYQNWKIRTVLFIAGAIAITICGSYLGFYTLQDAIGVLRGKIDILYLILGMNIITIILDEGGFFEYLGKKIALLAWGNRWTVLFLFCLLTYLCSLLVNNLTTIMVTVPVILRLSRYLQFDPKAYIIGMIIASNLGGASTMVGDFPNILIGLETGLNFHQFLLYMAPVCLIQLLVLIIYLRLSQKPIFTRKSPSKEQQRAIQELPQLAPCNGAGLVDPKEKFFDGLKQSLKSGLRNKKAVRRALLVLGLLIIALFISGFVHICPAILALTAGVVAMFFCGVAPTLIIEKLNFRDILFFAGLFVLVGAAEFSGLLSWIGELIVYLSFGSIFIRCLLLMWGAAAVTAFLNAGPSTALFLPLIASFGMASPHNLYFWALSLGVLAGSSATLTGATAGSVASTLLDTGMTPLKHPKGEIGGAPSGSLSFKEYAKMGMPIALMFLVISSIYIFLIYQW